MNYILSFLIFFLISGAGQAQSARILYTCTMHPKVVAVAPGKCPVCGMTLVKKTVAAKAPAQSKPAGNAQASAKIIAKKHPVLPLKIPVKQKSAVKSRKVTRNIRQRQRSEVPQLKVTAGPHRAPDQAVYTCPMHPEVVSDAPGRCPKCGMELISNSAENAPEPIINAKILPLPAKRQGGGRTVRYDLYVKDTIVAYAGKPRKAIAVNGKIPMPALEFYEGDTAEVVVHNLMDVETSLHWHGLYLPNKEDGVPWLTQKPIAPHSEYKYSFPLIQNGTHWYHSHSGLQEQVGMYGMFIIKKRPDDPTFRNGIDDLPTVPLILSEWTNIKPENIQRLLHNASDWFAIRKGSTQSYSEAIREGHFGTKVTNEWKRMLAMDVSDVYYDAFLINGKQDAQLAGFKAGDKVRLRIANGGASSYFWLNYGGGSFQVVASDGNDIEPVTVDRLLLAVSETADIVITIPEEHTAYELLVTPEDRSKSVSMYFGNGIKQLAAPLPKLKYFEGMKMMNDMMKMNGDMKDMGMKMSYQTMDMNAVMYPEVTGAAPSKPAKAGHHDAHGAAVPPITTLNYGMMKSPYDTSLPKDRPVRELTFTLTGNMNRYVWSMDHKVMSETDKIPVKKGEILRIRLINNSMMRHPMHLHGFDFRVLNSHGVQAPLKNVLDVMPMETDVIEFAANEEGDWFFHCHILYHMMAGMNRIFTVGNYKNPYLPDRAPGYKMLQHESNMWHLMAENDFATNGNDGMAMIANARWELTAEWSLGYSAHHGYEAEAQIGRYVDNMQWLRPFVGYSYRYRKMHHGEMEKNLFGQRNEKDNRQAFSAGISYKLPLLVNFQGEVFSDGIVRFQLMREDIPLSPRLRGAFMVNTDKEYMAGLKYILTRNFALSTHYDSDMGWGGGFTLSY